MSREMTSYFSGIPPLTEFSDPIRRNLCNTEIFIVVNVLYLCSKYPISTYGKGKKLPVLVLLVQALVR